jgi:hypothetical protein
MVSMKELQGVVDDLKESATRKASDWIGESRGQVREAVGGHSDGALLGMFAVGLIVGCLAGAAIALIVTPFSGSEARRRLSEKVEKAKQSTAEMVPTNGEMAPTHGETTPTNGSSRSSRSPASPYAG